ncbi:tumor necrosis factor ligand superfamily member 8 [Rhineura floridana]|uniref:tumor necrosis factor ligand superfamily member 8 n=1 Tax=Rhineura floridana TaxID=261503 RepID=UPI002AC85298|nr:tumor necrosis factor ligand superfamily member 8 [Rhineura floridana]
MTSQTEQRAFMRVNCPQEATRDMTEESITRQFSAPIQTYFCFALVSLTICLLASLGTIVVLVLQKTGSAAQCDGPQDGKECGEAMKSLQTMESKKAAAYLPVLMPIKRPELRWSDEGILHNIHYDNGTLVIQMPGMYFIYCHLHIYVAKCERDEINLQLELLLNGSVVKQTVLTLCSTQQTCKEKRQDLFLTFLEDLKMGTRITARINQFSYVDVNDFPQNNILGVLKYTGETWRLFVQDSN